MGLKLVSASSDLTPANRTTQGPVRPSSAAHTLADMDDYLVINEANWDARAATHVAAGYGIPELLADPEALSGVVRFDLPLLGRLDRLDVVHLQCHLGTDTLSLARLGARSVVGVDLSGESLRHARDLAGRGGASIDYVRSDVYSAPDALAGRTFDLVYTGIGALCWLPSVSRWAEVVSQLLRPGGRLFIRECHPMLSTLVVAPISAAASERETHGWLTAPGELAPVVDYPYFEQDEPLEWNDAISYYGDLPVTNPRCLEWPHGLGEIVSAVLDAGLTLTALREHDSVPWNALPGLMTADATGEHRLQVRPERLAASYTLIATQPLR